MTYPFARWRLLNSGEADGATNMAIDEAILRAVAAGLVPPTLRFYAWQPACLSLGQAQPFADVDEPACRVRGQARPDSDLDLLVVLPRVEDKRRATLDIMRALNGLPVSKDIVVPPPAEIAARGNTVGYVLREGQVLYECP